MASPTNKRKKIRKAKGTAQGSRRKKEIRRQERLKLAEVGKKLGLPTKGMLATLPTAE
jgi:hypothetical protein